MHCEVNRIVYDSNGTLSNWTTLKYLMLAMTTLITPHCVTELLQWLRVAILCRPT